MDANSEYQSQALQVFRRIFQLCDVDNRGQISVNDIISLGGKYLDQDTHVSSC